MDGGWNKNKPKYIVVQVHDIRESLPKGALNNVLCFHSVTGTDFSSQFAGRSMKSAWTVLHSRAQPFTLLF